MIRTFAACAFATAGLLALTTGANAANATARGNPTAAKSDNRPPLWLAQAPQSEPNHIFNGNGIVTAIQPAGTLTISHEAIEGLMGAMEMTFSVKPAALAKGVRPGDKIEFSVDGKSFTIVGLKVTGHTH
jgi:Cu/Ag efflux protein CusF